MNDSKISRRHFLQMGVGGAAALFLQKNSAAAEETSHTSSSSFDTDVCVIGAGFAGLCAAFTLKKAGKSVVLLEARNRIGGRSLSIQLKNGAWIDEGGQWLGPTQNRFYDYVKEMGCKTYPSPNFGKAIVYGIKEPKYYYVRDDWSHIAGIEIVDEIKVKLQLLADSINPEAPWEHPKSLEWDAITFDQWLHQNVSNEQAISYIKADMSYACAGAQEITLLSLLTLIKACGGFDRLNNFEGGAQQDRVIGGTQSVAKKIAEHLTENIHLQQPVHKIQWSDNKATVYALSKVITAKRVIFAGPPVLVGGIEYEPGLPTQRTQVTQHWPQGTVMKIAMVYKKPWWREYGYSGMSLDYSSYVSETADSSTPPEYSAAGVLTGFIYTNKVLEISRFSSTERKKIVLEEMAKRFGKEALNPEHYHEMNWSTQNWTRGCYGGYFGPGALSTLKSAFKDPIGPLHWAGTETSTGWPTFIEGAIRSGERAAQEVLHALG